MSLVLKEHQILASYIEIKTNNQISKLMYMYPSYFVLLNILAKEFSHDSIFMPSFPQPIFVNYVMEMSNTSKGLIYFLL